MLQEKKISSKINYDVLKDLNKTTSSNPQKPDIAALQRDLISGPIEVTPVTFKSPRSDLQVKLSSQLNYVFINCISALNPCKLSC